MTKPNIGGVKRPRKEFDFDEYKRQYDNELQMQRDAMNLQLSLTSQNFAFQRTVPINQSSSSTTNSNNNVNPSSNNVNFSNRSSSSTTNLSNEDDSSIAIVDDDLDEASESEEDSQLFGFQGDGDSVSSNKTSTTTASVKSNLTTSTSATIKRTDKSIQLAYLDVKLEDLYDFKCGGKCQFGRFCTKHLTVDEICIARKQLWEPPTSFQVVTTSERGERYFKLLNSANKVRNEKETLYSFQLDHSITGKQSKSQICEGNWRYSAAYLKIFICHFL
jgi:hypothetical protein